MRAGDWTSCYWILYDVYAMTHEDDDIWIWCLCDFWWMEFDERQETMKSIMTIITTQGFTVKTQLQCLHLQNKYSTLDKPQKAKELFTMSR